MLNLYCYNSPARSSDGFQLAQWTVSEGQCSALELQPPAELHAALIGGGAEALCLDTGRNTRAFVFRNIHVDEDAPSGWHINFALETDSKSYALWADAVAAFLLDYDGCVHKFADLFSVHYDEGEHYAIDEVEFVDFLKAAQGSAQTLCQSAGDRADTPSRQAVQTLTRRLCAPHIGQKRALLFLVPTATVDYFLAHTSIRGRFTPQMTLSVEQWTALLEHRELPPDAPSPNQTARDHKRSPLPILLGSAAAVGMALILYRAYRACEDKHC